MNRAGIVSSIASLALVAAALPAAATGQTDPLLNPDARPTRPVLERCDDPVRNATVTRELIDAIRAAVAALPPERQTAEDIEAAIVYVIGQRELCPGIARAALNSLRGVSSAAFRQAVARVSNSLLPGSGTAGLRATGDNLGSGSFFSPPVVGIGGGSANYSQ